MSLESSVTQLVEEASALIDTFKGKKSEIDAAINQALTGAIKKLPYSQTKTVGANGDFETINEAIDYFQNYQTKFVANSDSTRFGIRLLSGFIVREQIIANWGLDLSSISIESEDEEVLIDCNYLTKEYAGSKSFLTALRNSALPVINTLFVMGESGKTTEHHGCSIRIGSQVVFQPGAGIKNAGGDGLSVLTQSKAYAYAAIFSGAARDGISANQGGYIVCDWSMAKECGANGYVAKFGSTIVMNSANGVIDSDGVESSSDITCAYGSTIIANGATGGLSLASNTLTSSGIIYK